MEKLFLLDQQFAASFAPSALLLNSLDQLFASSGGSSIFAATPNNCAAKSELEEGRKIVQGRETDKETEKQNGKKKKEDESWSCSSAGEDNEEEDDESSSREQAPEADEDVRADEAADAELVLNVTCLDQGPDQLRQDECVSVNSAASSSCRVSLSSASSSSASPLLRLRHHHPHPSAPPLPLPATIDPSSSSSQTPAAAGAASGLGDQVPGAQQQRRHEQLSPSASITDEVRRVTIEDRHPAQHQLLATSATAATESGDIGGRNDGNGEHAKLCRKLSRSPDGRARALRKHAAVEDEEHPLLESGSTAVSTSFLGHGQALGHPGHDDAPGHLLPPSALSPLLSPNQQLAIAAAAASVVRPSPQHPLASQQQQLDPAVALQLAALLQQQQQQLQQGMTVKQEPQMSREEQLLSSLVHSSQSIGRDQQQQLLAWQQQQSALNALASLNALMQQQQRTTTAEGMGHAELAPLLEAAGGSGTRLLPSIQEEQGGAGSGGSTTGLDMSQLLEMTGRNQSTESTASTSGGTATSGGGGTMEAGGGGGAGGHPVPRKQDIQTDIRMNRGRFQLVRKRGRSEVWNLFGQVVDTLTQQRLPYVACYACKVLYTDTGGGTGNMTRHRCSMGSSYRSSSDTTAGGDSAISINQQSSSSFESIGAGSALAHGALSPQEDFPPSASQMLHQFREQHRQQHRHAEFAKSGSSGFLSTGSTASVSSAPTSSSMDSSSTVHHPQYHQLHLALGPPPMLSSARFAASTAPALPSASASLLAPLLLPASAATGALHPVQSHSVSPSMLASPSIPATRTPILAGFGQGHHFTQADKQLFAQAMVQFCSQDMHNHDVVEGEGFKNLIETVLFIGRRSHGDPSANTYDPVRNLIPSSRQLKQIFTNQEQTVRHATMRDLALVKDLGVALSCQTLEFAGERHVAVSANYITDDWRITRRTLRVEKSSTMELSELVREVLEEFQLGEAKVVLLTMDSTEMVGAEVQAQMPDNVLLLPNANCALNTILAKSLGECPDSAHISAFVRLCFRLVVAVRDADRLGKFPQAVVLGRKASVKQGQAPLDFANDVYLAVKLVKEHATELAALLEREGMEELALELRQINWQACAELEMFLEPFHETAQMFADSKQPHFQRIVPEWFALMHECQPQQSMDEPSASSAGEGPMELKMEETISPGEAGHGPSHAQGPQSAGSISSSSDTPSWLRSVRQATSRRLRDWADVNLRVEHRVATVLNPRLRQLPLICSDGERTAVYERIRDLVGLSRKQRRDPSEEKTPKNEPFKKRRRFLDRLEDAAMEEEDELDAYLRFSFTAAQTRDILEFWSSVGESQFPRLARLARFILASSGAPAPIPLQQPSAATLGPHEIGTLLNLRPEVLNSLSHHPHRHGQQQLPSRQHPSASSME